MSKVDWSKADELLEELDRDTREGQHVFVVDELREMDWENEGGGKTYSLDGTLETAGDAKASALLADPEPQMDMTKEQLRGLPTNQRRSISLNLRLNKQLDEHYETTLDDLKNGATDAKFGVETYKTPRNPITGKGGFIRIRAFIPLDRIGAEEEGGTSF